MKRPVSRARLLRRNATRAEDLLWKELRNRQLGRWKFRRQHPIDRFIVDFVSLDGRLVIEVDGATHSEPRDLRHDAERTRILESLGFHVVRITNEDVYSNMDGVLNSILHELGSI